MVGVGLGDSGHLGHTRQQRRGPCSPAGQRSGAGFMHVLQPWALPSQPHAKHLSREINAQVRQQQHTERLLFLSSLFFFLTLEAIPRKAHGKMSDVKKILYDILSYFESEYRSCKVLSGTTNILAESNN